MAAEPQFINLLVSAIKSSCCVTQDIRPIDHFTVVCLVAWPLNESEAGGDLVLIEISLLFLC